VFTVRSHARRRVSTRRQTPSFGLVTLRVCTCVIVFVFHAASALADEPANQASVTATPSSTTESASARVSSGSGPTIAASQRLDSPVASERKKRSPMGPFALGIQVGMAHVGTGDVANPTYVSTAKNLDQDQLRAAGLIGTGGCDIVDKRCHTDARRGVHLSVPIQLGGTGVGFRLEPFITIAPSATAYGVYTGPTFEFQVANPLYLGFGFGLKAAWVRADGWRYAADLYGRIPVHATVYVTDSLAFVGEFAFGAGASGYISDPQSIVLPGGTSVAHKENVTFGFGRTWDFSFGLRFP
jgi:hypothetical protein